MERIQAERIILGIDPGTTGMLTEIDPSDPSSVPIKRAAPGRFGAVDAAADIQAADIVQTDSCSEHSFRRRATGRKRRWIRKAWRPKRRSLNGTKFFGSLWVSFKA